MFTILKMFILVIYTFILSTSQVHSQGTVTQTPSTACVGDRITISCILTPPAGQTFTAIAPRFLIGNVSSSLSAFNINGSISHPDVDLTRLTAYTNAGSVTMVSGVVTLLSYLTSDEGLRIGCEVALNNGPELIETIQLIQSAPPSPPNGLQNYASNFNTANCSADISLTWNTPPSNRTVDSYFLYLDGSPQATTNSTSYIHSTFLNINTDYQFSVTAMSCAGNSTNSSTNVNTMTIYSLMRSSHFVCLDYNNVTGNLTINWELSTPTEPSGGLDITYSLQLLYSHSRQGVTYKYTDSTSFTLPSSQLSYNTTITPHNFTQLDEVETDIATNLLIVQQCGQAFNGITVGCLLTSNNPSIPTILSTTPTPTDLTFPTTAVPYNTGFSPQFILPILIIVILLFILSLALNITCLIIVIFMAKRNKQLVSVSKPAPSHPYEYIDLNKMSGNISSPTQLQSPQDYVPMSSISKQDSIQPPTQYANLK